MEKKHYNITISGRVQGVGFRFSTREMARSTGVKGYVRNLPSGQVYIEVEGSEVQLRHFLSWCHQGPRYGKVDQVTFTEGEFKAFSLFDIKA